MHVRAGVDTAVVRRGGAAIVAVCIGADAAVAAAVDAADAMAVAGTLALSQSTDDQSATAAVRLRVDPSIGGAGTRLDLCVAVEAAVCETPDTTAVATQGAAVVGRCCVFGSRATSRARAAIWQRTSASSTQTAAAARRYTATRHASAISSIVSRAVAWCRGDSAALG